MQHHRALGLVIWPFKNVVFYCEEVDSPRSSHSRWTRSPKFDGRSSSWFSSRFACRRLSSRPKLAGSDHSQLPFWKFLRSSSSITLPRWIVSRLVSSPRPMGRWLMKLPPKSSTWRRHQCFIDSCAWVNVCVLNCDYVSLLSCEFNQQMALTNKQQRFKI